MLLGYLLSSTAALSISSQAFAQVYISGTTEIVDGTAQDSGTQLSPWSAGSTLTVGGVEGELQIIEAGKVYDNYGYVEGSSGSFATATVNGVGSLWANSGDLYVGTQGKGYLNTLAGGL